MMGTGQGAFKMEHETLRGISAVPMTYLISRHGKVAEAWYEYREGQAEIALKRLSF
jgi:hypothetical protein